MKKLLTQIATILISINLFAQAPQKMSYQAVIRDISGNLLINKPIKIRVSRLNESATGRVQYTELHNTVSNING